MNYHSHWIEHVCVIILFVLMKHVVLTTLVLPIHSRMYKRPRCVSFFSYLPVVNFIFRSQPYHMYSCYTIVSCFGAIMVSAFTIQPKVHRFKPDHGDRFFKGHKNPQRTFLCRRCKARGHIA